MLLVIEHHWMSGWETAGNIVEGSGIFTAISGLNVENTVTSAGTLALAGSSLVSVYSDTTVPFSNTIFSGDTSFLVQAVKETLASLDMDGTSSFETSGVETGIAARLIWASNGFITVNNAIEKLGQFELSSDAEVDTQSNVSLEASASFTSDGSFLSIASVGPLFEPSTVTATSSLSVESDIEVGGSVTGAGTSDLTTQPTTTLTGEVAASSAATLSVLSDVKVPGNTNFVSSGDLFLEGNTFVESGDIDFVSNASMTVYSQVLVPTGALSAAASGALTVLSNLELFGVLNESGISDLDIEGNRSVFGVPAFSANLNLVLDGDVVVEAVLTMSSASGMVVNPLRFINPDNQDIVTVLTRYLPFSRGYLKANDSLTNTKEDNATYARIYVKTQDSDITQRVPYSRITQDE